MHECLTIFALKQSECLLITQETIWWDIYLSVCLGFVYLLVLKQGLTMHPWLVWNSLSCLSFLRVYSPGICHNVLENPMSSVMNSASIFLKMFSVHLFLLCKLLSFSHFLNRFVHLFLLIWGNLFCNLLFVKGFSFSSSSFNYEDA